MALDLSFDGETVTEIGHQVRGCVLCQASAAILSGRVKGMTKMALAGRKAQLAAALADQPGALQAMWPELAAFAPVRPHKSRHDCVLLPFQALEEAIAADRAEGRPASAPPER
jgi:nitrogen fixation NifU-like protein